jgi:cytochrome P450
MGKVMLLELLRKLSHWLEPDIGLGSKDIPQEVMQHARQELELAGKTVERFFSELMAHAAEHPEPIFAILRRVNPILVQKSQVLVTRFKDAQEVLLRDDVFDVPYAEKMRQITDGQNFFLGMPDSPRYAQDVSNMRIVVRREDITTLVAPIVEQAAEHLVANAPGVLEVVSGLTQLVPARLVGQYLGAFCPSEPDLIGWATTLFWYLFQDPQNDPGLKGRALSASAALNAAIDRCIAERKATATATDDVLNRSLHLQSAGTPGMSDLDIRNNFVGLIIGAIPTTATASALVLDELLRRPDQLAGATRAACAGDDSRLAGFVFEAMRFNPMSPAMYRRANRDFILAQGEPRETLIPANATVLVATQSATFDEHYIHEPKEFRIDRSPREALHFGYGLHTCFGQYINRVQIPGILKPLLRQKYLRRADGVAGQYQKAGPLAGSLTLRFD